MSVSEKRSKVSHDKGRGLSVESDKLGEKDDEDEKTWKSCKETSRPEELSLSGPIVDAQIETVGAESGKCFTFFSLLFKGVTVGLWFTPLCPF